MSGALNLDLRPTYAYDEVGYVGPRPGGRGAPLIASIEASTPFGITPSSIDMTLRVALPSSFARHIRTGRELADARRRAPEEVHGSPPPQMVSIDCSRGGSSAVRWSS